MKRAHSRVKCRASFARYGCGQGALSTRVRAKTAARNLLGLRFPKEFGGRGLNWESEVLALEEIGVLGASLACLFSLPSIVGEALNVFGTREQKEKWLRPTLAGELTVAEALTEPRGGYDFSARRARDRDGNVYVLNGQKRFIVGAEGADCFFVYRAQGTNRAL